MIVHYLNVMRLAVTPDKANSPLIVNSNAMLARSIPPERLKPAARRNAKILQPPGSMKVEQFTPTHAFDGLKPEHGVVVEQRLGVAASKRPDQDSFYDVTGIPSTGMTIFSINRPVGSLHYFFGFIFSNPWSNSSPRSAAATARLSLPSWR